MHRDRTMGILIVQSDLVCLIGFDPLAWVYLEIFACTLHDKRIDFFELTNILLPF